MTEKHVWTRLKKALDKIKAAQYHRIELKTAETGFPDVMYVYGGVGFIELKYGKDLKQWRPDQRRWAKHKEAVGVPCYVLLGDTDGTHLYRSKNPDVPIASWGPTIDPDELAYWLVQTRDREWMWLRDNFVTWPTEILPATSVGGWVKSYRDGISFHSNRGGRYTESEFKKRAFSLDRVYMDVGQ